jgi:hypothetical protein
MSTTAAAAARATKIGPLALRESSIDTATPRPRNQYVTQNRRILIRSATEWVEPSNTAGGTTAAAAASATVPRGAFMIACVTLPATDIDVAANNHAQKKRVAARAPTSSSVADVMVMNPLRSSQRDLLAFAFEVVSAHVRTGHNSVSASQESFVHRFAVPKDTAGKDLADSVFPAAWAVSREFVEHAAIGAQRLRAITPALPTAELRDAYSAVERFIMKVIQGSDDEDAPDAWHEAVTNQPDPITKAVKATAAEIKHRCRAGRPQQKRGRPRLRRLPSVGAATVPCSFGGGWRRMSGRN